MRLCIVLQYHEADYYRAMELAQFIADIEPRKRADVAFCFYGRWDAMTPAPAPLAAVERKFERVVHYRTKLYKWTGWPAGPNGIAKEVLEGAPLWLRHAGIGHVDALLLLEPDCVPFACDWIDQMIEDWDTFGEEEPNDGGAWQIGAWRDSGGPGGHINGCCLIVPDVARRIPMQCITQHLAWDCAIAPLMREHWYHSWLFRNDFDSRDAIEAMLLTPIRGEHSPVLIHGYKDNSALKIARRRLLPRIQTPPFP